MNGRPATGRGTTSQAFKKRVHDIMRAANIDGTAAQGALLDRVSRILPSKHLDEFVALLSIKEQVLRIDLRQVIRAFLLHVLKSWDYGESLPADIIDTINSIEKLESRATRITELTGITEPSTLSWNTLQDAREYDRIYPGDGKKILPILLAFNKKFDPDRTARGNLAGIVHDVVRLRQRWKESTQLPVLGTIAEAFSMAPGDVVAISDALESNLNTASYVRQIFDIGALFGRHKYSIPRKTEN